MAHASSGQSGVSIGETAEATLGSPCFAKGEHSPRAKTSPRRFQTRKDACVAVGVGRSPLWGGLREDFESSHFQEEAEPETAIVPVKITSGTHRAQWNKLAKLADSRSYPSIAEVWNTNDRTKKNELLKSLVMNNNKNADKIESDLQITSTKGTDSRKVRACVTLRQMRKNYGNVLSRLLDAQWPCHQPGGTNRQRSTSERGEYHIGCSSSECKPANAAFFRRVMKKQAELVVRNKCCHQAASLVQAAGPQQAPKARCKTTLPCQAEDS